MTLSDFPILGIVSLTLHVAEAVALFVMWVRSPGEGAGEAVRALTRRVDVLDERISHMPTKEKQAELAGTVKEIDAKLDGQAESIAAVRRQMDRIETWMLNHRG